MTPTMELTLTYSSNDVSGNLLPRLSPEVEQKWRQALQIFHNDAARPTATSLPRPSCRSLTCIAKRRFPASS
jgi:hypothetical protein